MVHDDPDWDSEGLDPDGPSSADLERFGAETVRCPSCGGEVWDQADACHRCGGALDAETADSRLGKRSRVALLLALFLIAVIGILTQI